MTQEQLAEAVGVSDGRVVRFWESGHAAPEFGQIEKLAQVLDVPVQSLFDFSQCG